MQTPNITTAQVATLVSTIAGLVAAFGFHLSTAAQTATVHTILVVAPVALLADAVIRHGRAGMAASMLETQARAAQNATTAAARADTPATPPAS
jgi:hypothetical protein